MNLRKEATPDLDTQTRVTPDNDVQKRLRAILDYWGDVGERHAVGRLGGEFGVDDGPRCAVGVVHHLKKKNQVDDNTHHRMMSAMQIAAVEMGFRIRSACNNSGFPNARAMVLRAIQLAA